jgi:hypothetical protein
MSHERSFSRTTGHAAVILGRPKARAADINIK